MDEPTPSAPDAAATRSWVWHATVESRAAGKVSVLACVETLFAVILYWWIAIRYDTHWHLLSSVFIAPLLLLRSPESMKLGVRWFLKDWWGFEDYEKWPKARRDLLLTKAAVLSGIFAYSLTHWVCSPWLVEQIGWPLLGWSMLVGGLSHALAVTAAVMSLNIFLSSKMAASLVKVVGGGVVAGAAMGAGLSVGMYAGVVAGTGAFIGVFAGASLGANLFAYLGLGMGLGFACRGLICRVGATLRYFSRGVRRLAENWQENNFWVDSLVPVELMPGIREMDRALAIDGLFHIVAEAKNRRTKWIFGPLLVVCCFLPAFLYRLNIKATCWFWWPLAYLLKPVPKADKESAQKQALCWPWDNPLQMLLILVPGVLVLGILAVEYCDFGVWKEFKNAAAVPIPLKVALGMGWGHIPPWHWALLVVELAGLGMLGIAGKARSHRASDDWESYAQCGMQRDLWRMDKLMRLRSLAAKAFMVLGLGMCLISFPEWRQYVPDALLQRVERFYGTHEVSAPAGKPPAS